MKRGKGERALGENYLEFAEKIGHLALDASKPSASKLGYSKEYAYFQQSRRV
jgi:hypothetical protein